MNEPFHATIKLVTGEEVLAEVTLMEENGSDFFLVNDAIVVNETTQVDHQKGVAISGLVPKKWQLYANDSMTIINKQHVISISELDKFGTEFYIKALMAAKMSSPIKRKVDSTENVGYVGNVSDSRELLERMYDMSMDVSDDPLN
jgi:hypothetical protein